MKIAVRFFLLFVIISILSSCHAIKTLYRNGPELNDYRFFVNATIPHAKKPFYFHEKIQNNVGDQIIVTPVDKNYELTEKKTLNEHFDESPVVAMLIIRNDSIIYERYDEDFPDSYKFASFSMAKSIVLSPLLAIAVDEGNIHSLDDPVTHYIEEFRGKPGFDKVTIRHLINFKAGLKEGWSAAMPFSTQTRSYYGKRLDKEFKRMKVKRNPGKKYKYSTTRASHVLGEIIERTMGQSLESLYISRIWSQIGTTEDALWSMDRKGGQVKPFCCFHARARDYAKLGRLILNEGKWNGKQILPEYWVGDLYKCADECDSQYIKASSNINSDYNYQHWFLGTKGYNEIKASGLFGQYVYVFPDQNTLMLTFTNRKGLNRGIYQIDIHYEIIDQLGLFK